MKFKADLVVEAWFRGLEIEANSEEEARDALARMSLEDFLSEGYIKDLAVKDIDLETTEETITVNVMSIEYDVGYEVEESGRTEEEILMALPDSLIFTFDYDMEEDIDEAVRYELEDQVSSIYGHYVDITDFSYHILKHS